PESNAACQPCRGERTGTVRPVPSHPPPGGCWPLRATEVWGAGGTRRLSRPVPSASHSSPQLKLGVSWEVLDDAAVRAGPITLPPHQVWLSRNAEGEYDTQLDTPCSQSSTSRGIDRFELCA